MHCKRLGFVVLSLFTFLIISHNSHARPGTSAPWWLFYNRLMVSVGADETCIKIGKMTKEGEGQFHISLSALCSEEKNQALATLFTQERDFPGALVKVNVYGPDGQPISPKPFPETIPEAKKVIESALTGNPFFLGLLKGNPYYAFFIEFKKEVAQFPGDNYGDAYFNMNEVAAISFFNALDLENIKPLNIGVTTTVTQKNPFARR